jgi:hypothetical protein
MNDTELLDELILATANLEFKYERGTGNINRIKLDAKVGTMLPKIYHERTRKSFAEFAQNARAAREKA